MPDNLTLTSSERDVNKAQQKLPFLEPWPLITGCWVGYAVTHAADVGWRRLGSIESDWVPAFHRAMITWWGWIAYGIVFNLAVGAALGFAAGYYAQHNKIRHAIAACLVLRIGELLSSYQGVNFMQWSFTFVMLIGGSLYGAFMAQSFQRNRDVKIV